MEIEENKEIHNNPKTIKARLLMNYVLLFVFLLFIFIRGYSRLGEREYLIIGVFIIIWLIITILTKPNVVNCYKEGLEEIKVSAKTEIRWKDVNIIQILSDPKQFGKGNYLDFVYKENEHFQISLNDYSRKNIQILCKAIVSSCPNAEITDKIRKMAEGKFPWYIF